MRDAKHGRLMLDLAGADIQAMTHMMDSDKFSELRVAAAVKWYELERVSQGRGAEIAGLTRAGFSPTARHGATRKAASD